MRSLKTSSMSIFRQSDKTGPSCFIPLAIGASYQLKSQLMSNKIGTLKLCIMSYHSLLDMGAPNSQRVSNEKSLLDLRSIGQHLFVIWEIAVRALI